MKLIDKNILDYCIKRDTRSGIKRKPTDWGYYLRPVDALWFWKDDSSYD